MKRQTNNERLRELMRKHHLTRIDVSNLLHMSITKDRQTPAVNKWLARRTDKNNFRHVNDSMIELLEYKLGEREVVKWRAA